MMMAAVATTALCACGALNAVSPESAVASANRVNPAGANVLLDGSVETFDDAKLVSMIYPVERTGASAGCRYEHGATDIAGAVTCFTLDPDGLFKDERAKKEYRNAVQFTLMLASDNRCNLYYTYITRAGAISRGTSSVLSTIFGGVGAIVTGDASRVFSGLSGISSGVGADVDAAMFHNVAEAVLIPAIRQMRAAKRHEIEVANEQSPADYPITRAIADALDYHALCSVSAALDKARSGIQAPAAGAPATGTGGSSAVTTGAGG